MNARQTSLLEFLTEQAEDRVRELVEQAKLEFYEAADQAFSRAVERFFRPGPHADHGRNGEPHSELQQAG
jgi:hypothetical protein